jgi:F-type H+-transporting ATPase subunit b
MLEVSYGTMIWMTIAFVVVLIILKKFAWKPILQALKDREDFIEDSLQQAEQVKKEMMDLQSSNKELLAEARTERDILLKEARETKNDIINEAKELAVVEGDKMIADARDAIKNEKLAALTELKNEVGVLSLEIAEKLMRQDLSESKKQNELVEKLLNEVKLNK